MSFKDLAEFIYGGIRMSIRKATVLGAGVMGSQIAALLVNAGMKVELLDVVIDKDDPNKLAKQGYDSIVNPKKSQLYDQTFVENITYGNFDDNLTESSDADIFIEAVKEEISIKHDIWKKVAKVAKDHAILATNTSGIPINAISKALSKDLQKRFIGLHFFNPPRYMKLVEIIPNMNSSEDVVQKAKLFAEDTLGKGVVVAKDVPAFVANRTGIHTLNDIMYRAEQDGLSINEVDALTGKVIGRPMGTYQLSDLVGNDIGQFVIKGLQQDKSESDFFKTPELLPKLVEKGALGRKAKHGFYKKEGKNILVVNPETLEYKKSEKPQLEILEQLQKSITKNLDVIFESDTKGGKFLWETLRNMFIYAAHNVPKATDEFIDIDRAMVWGFNWRKGPFELWDTMGFERVKDRIIEEGYDLPEWVKEKSDNFYDEDVLLENVTPIEELETGVVWDRDNSSKLSEVNNQLLFKFQTPKNTITPEFSTDLIEAIDKLENEEYTSMVIYSDGANFSVGANLMMIKFGLDSGAGSEFVEGIVKELHEAVNRLRYSTKPIVTAASGRALGGGAELLLASPYVVAAAETYIGLVEVGVGLIPGGGGLAELTERVMTQDTIKANKVKKMSDVVKNIASAHVNMNAYEARRNLFLRDTDTIIANADKRVEVALEKAKFLGSINYIPKSPQKFQTLGRDFKALAQGQLEAMRVGNFISDYDFKLAVHIANIMTGGDLPEGAYINQAFIQRLERETFVALTEEEKTQDRITHMLETKKPLRN